MGGGTYTGIEAVSNGIAIMRAPRLATAKRTMLYMAISLALTAGGILLIYMLGHVQPTPEQTLNASALANLVDKMNVAGYPEGHWVEVVTLVRGGALLFVAAQTGFIDGPRVMANMALDLWLPHRFAALSDRLAMKNGVVLMGLSSVAFLLLTHGSVDALVVMYSINVFITFSLSQLGMVRLWIRSRKQRGDWLKQLIVQSVGLVMCVSILVLTLSEKFLQGGWLTLVVTSLVVFFCYLIRWDYRMVAKRLQRLNEILSKQPSSSQRAEAPAIDPRKPTAVQLVQEYGGLGIHLFLNVQRSFPGFFHNFVFVTVGILDSAAFKGVNEVERLEQRTETNVNRYVELAHRLGVAATGRETLGTDPVADTAKLCIETAQAYPHPVIFGGKLVFEEETWYQRFLHNDIIYGIQKRIQAQNYPVVILPVRVGDSRLRVSEPPSMAAGAA